MAGDNTENTDDTEALFAALDAELDAAWAREERRAGRRAAVRRRLWVLWAAAVAATLSTPLLLTVHVGAAFAAVAAAVACANTAWPATRDVAAELYARRGELPLIGQPPRR